MSEKTIIVIGGPTAVGKTNLSIELAKKINGEIISADSMQIYKHMDIGSAKVKVEDRMGITHHLIDVINPDEAFTVADFKRLGEEALNDIWCRGKVPIIAGGTGLYINALTCNMTFTEGEKDLNYRMELDELANKFGNDYIHEMLKKIDPISYKEIHSNNRKRVIRALEVYKITGKPFSSYNLGNDMYNSPYNVKYYVLNMDREHLYERINKRVDIMMNEGLLNECIELKKMGYTSSMQSMQGIGYKEILYHLDGTISLDKAVDMIKQGSRNYAKRQLTWFRKDPRVKFFDKDNLDENDILMKIIGDITFN